ncbi:MAG: single-stranded-DNA-specific exonuclease RecJ [Calditrichaceae bacterium]|nr:single-stranded-DNA-specific exonuclease RecJ [Calditrichaceae bacterium]RQV97634.1 MAG: single-stranded-DNA-specific exonuclease RecJ [Calditrichota bacterium]
MKYQWIKPAAVNPSIIKNLTEETGLHPIVMSILYNRFYRSAKEIETFLRADLDQLHDPFLFKEMQKAVERIIIALREGENILIYGDYDVDGVTGVSVLYDGLFKMGGKVSFFIPDRFEEGYGVSAEGIKKARNRGTSLMITVDCGITAVDEVAFASQSGIDTIICDHHEPGESLPAAVAVIDAKIKECPYPFKELAGCGVAFKLLQAIAEYLGTDPSFANQYLDLVAIGTSADIVTLTGENRVLVKHGLSMINENPRPGLFALMENCGMIGKELTVNKIVFVLAPRLNAVGRISNAKKAVHLLTTTSLQQGKNISKILEKENETRKNIDEVTFMEAQQLLDETIDLDKKRVLVIARENWHTGVIGIVASRLLEKMNRPTVLISIQDGVGKGSARSLPTFDIYEAFRKLDHLLINYGGHQYAAGLTISAENIPVLDDALNQIAEDDLVIEEMVPKLSIDAEVRFKDLDANFFNDLKAMAPHGPGNMRPVFVTSELCVFGNASIVGHNHLKLKFKQDDVVIDAIGYNLGDYLNQLKNARNILDCAYVLEETRWSGQTTIQMRIRDLMIG